MRNGSIYILFYAVTLAVYIFSITAHQPIPGYISKLFLSLILAIYFYNGTSGVPAVFRILPLSALFFAGLGDMCLLFAAQERTLFTMALGIFILSLLSYSGFFLKIRYSNYPLPKCQWAFIIISEAAIVAFIYLMLPYLGSMAVPVILFTIAISLALQCVRHAFRLEEQPQGWYALAGALLYVVSSAFIAIQYFYHPIPGGEIYIISTYGLAQLGLIQGGLLYLRMRMAPANNELD
ncbi:lysoplasmalogenase family protein [Chitinophaga tropicalis]|uniref:Lysoplasmalogenase n=1 Tax=Chitinophaga tropicalis TaxID=2683588 RepID=A0A7K1TZ36_9BACT|nr:lysoplasmalogenase family protein [Chitinophaga tropicalis]MVT07326.1 hypothetical protein [Chitinophaga tropicalis]